DVQGILETQLAIGKFQLGGVVGKHLPTTPRVVVAGLAIDGDAHVDALAVALARSGGERCFQRLENDLLVDALLVRHRVDDHQNLFVHRANSASSSIYIFGARRALCISPISSRTLLPSTFNVISRSVTAASWPENRLRPSTGCLISTRTRSPAKRSKCAG